MMQLLATCLAFERSLYDEIDMLSALHFSSLCVSEIKLVRFVSLNVNFVCLVFEISLAN